MERLFSRCIERRRHGHTSILGCSGYKEKLRKEEQRKKGTTAGSDVHVVRVPCGVASLAFSPI